MRRVRLQRQARETPSISICKVFEGQVTSDILILGHIQLFRCLNFWKSDCRTLVMNFLKIVLSARERPHITGSTNDFMHLANEYWSPEMRSPSNHDGLWTGIQSRREHVDRNILLTNLALYDKVALTYPMASGVRRNNPRFLQSWNNSGQPDHEERAHLVMD